MKQILNSSLKKNIFLFLLLVLLIAAIWFIGPLLSPEAQFPLKDPQNRWSLIISIIIAWLITFFFWNPATASPMHRQDITQMMHTLKGHFLGALQFLKKTIIDKHGFATPLNKLPWFLFIGPPSAGKTTLLANSRVNYILSKQYKQDEKEKEILPSSVCDWWITRDLVIVDVPGYYAFSSLQHSLTDTIPPSDHAALTQTPQHLGLWKNLLHLLTKYRQKNNIEAIIVALPLPELMKQSRQQQTLWFREIKERLKEVWNKLGNTPVYFIVTKCDLLSGFSEFFHDMGSDELTQPWGIPLTTRGEHESMLDAFTQRFNALIKRLNKQLIWRLHSERNADMRSLIKDFPLHLEFLKETLSHVIKTLLSTNPHLTIEGVYLISTLQENPCAAQTTTLFHHDTPSELPLSALHSFVSRTYFVKHIISHILPHTSHHLTQHLHQRKSYWPKLAYTVVLSSLLAGTLWLGRDFHYGLHQISKVQRYLTQYQLYMQQNNAQHNSWDSVQNDLSLLDTLETAAQSNTPDSSITSVHNLYSQKSRQTFITLYQKALQSLLISKIKNKFEKYLQTANDKNPEQLYAVLKAYLLLGHQDSKKENSASFILNTLQAMEPPFRKNLARHLQNALRIKQENLLDPKLVQQTRKIFHDLSPQDLAYILLSQISHNNEKTAISLGTNIGTPPALISKGTVPIVPRMFTGQAFSNIISEYIPMAALDAIKGNEVLGKNTLSSESLIPMDTRVTSLTEQLEKVYISRYINAWESLVDNISLNSPNNLVETDAMILNLVSARSPLLQLLQTINANTHFDLILKNSEQLQALNTLFYQTQTKQQDSLYQIFIDLQQLHRFLQAPQTALSLKEHKEDAYLRIIRTTAEKYPNPIKGWLQALAAHTQDQLLHHDISASEAMEPRSVLVQNAASPLPPSPPPQPSPTRGEGWGGGTTVPRLPVPALEKKSVAAEKISPKKPQEDTDIIEKKVLPEPETVTEPSLMKHVFKHASEKGEYIHVVPNKKRSLIFVQKD